MERRGADSEGGRKKDAKPLARCEEKRKEWAWDCQCGKEVQDVKDKPWSN